MKKHPVLDFFINIWLHYRLKIRNLTLVKKTIVELTLLESCLLGALVFCFAVQLYFSLFIHLKLALIKVEELPAQASKPLSVIICARNEAENLTQYLPAVLQQNYPDFEVIVVNDRSWDQTREVLKGFVAQYKNLKVVTVAEGEKFIAGKKFAVTMGIKAASNEWLVFTDADCVPASENWLSGMQQPENDETAIVLGYSPYIRKRGLLNSLIRFETFFTAVNYLAFAIQGMPYMGVGRNMAYKKSLFFKNKGFAAHMHIPSGDDDLFVNAHATRHNTEIRLNRLTHVWSAPNTSFSGYLRQKKRHFGAGKFYKAKHKFILSVQIIFQFLFYALFIVLMFFKPANYLAGGVFALSLIIRSFIYPRLLKRLNYPDLRWWFPILDILLFIFLVFNGILSIFVKKVKWK
ncbi:glycosyltransferase [Pedobacter cryoconitis]|uniref:Cellulose synthase/poly-beta-1,6-N-acetylglucosamine synthase-like glycosyltransferase n=1 Tax=Pedobacter cryoconitis TaxID=188932 RepID=A0A327T8U7_9SPHI|nr:glycosyltransferase [Pedobacter cryoconitis]RAJ37461.1 cellulose synthase/poly-beta-1,6-N-acetylglucosamine synthase-like glycosyltransferase [Pedobacter cryoconitis]